MGSPVLKASLPPGAVVPKQLLLHPVATWQPSELSSGEMDLCPFESQKIPSPVMGCLKSGTTIVLALIWGTQSSGSRESHTSPTPEHLPPCPKALTLALSIYLALGSSGLYWCQLDLRCCRRDLWHVCDTQHQMYTCTASSKEVRIGL